MGAFGSLTPPPPATLASIEVPQNAAVPSDLRRD
jgi:hypothetical protein